MTSKSIIHMDLHKLNSKLSLEIGISIILEAHNFLCKPPIETRFVQSFNFCQELFNDMWHDTCTHVIQNDFQLLVVGSQIDTLTLNLSFNHNLCCKYSNGSFRAIVLNVNKVASLYANLKKLYELHNYNPSHIWNRDELGAQNGCGGQRWVLAKKGSHSIDIIIPKK